LKPQLNRLDVTGGGGDKRKATPPDLLALSQMYFERNQVRIGLLKSEV
jgi:hypothetical protein